MASSALLAWLLAAAALAEEGECPAGAGEGGACAGAGGGRPARHHWPYSRGIPGSYGSTRLHGPLDLKASLAWSWEHPERQIMPGAVLLDEARNVYSPAMDGVRKFSPDGNMLWFYRSNGLTIANPSIVEDTLFSSTFTGYVFALNIHTGEERWAVRHADGANMDTPYVEASDGMVFAIFNSSQPEAANIAGNTRIVAMRAADGQQVWDYKSDKVLWNFMPMFVGDGTFITMDIHGGIYRFAMRDGARVWHTPAPAENAHSFTDGGVILGPGSFVAYTCSNKFGADSGGLGALRAYRVSDGKLLWDVELPQPCVSWPAVDADNRTVVVPIGPLPIPIPPALMLGFFVVGLAAAVLPLLVVCGGLGCALCRKATRRLRRCLCCLSVILILAVCSLPLVHWFSIYMGQQQHKLWRFSPKPMEVWAFDAQTGAHRWHFSDIPTWNQSACRNDEEELLSHLLKFDKRPVCGPASWGSPTIDGRGTVYVGGMNGILYAIGDANGDGRIDSRTEVSSLDIASASLHAGASFAPGMMAYGSCNGIHVFRT